MNQHYVPKGYLKLFADNGGCFYQGNLQYGHIKQVNVSGVCTMDDFYNAQDEAMRRSLDITDPEYVERNTFKFERELPKLLSYFKDRPEVILKEDANRIIEIYLRIKQKNPMFTLNLRDPQKMEQVRQATIQSVIEEIKDHPHLKDYIHLVASEANKVFKKRQDDPDRLRKSQIRNIMETHRKKNRFFDETFHKFTQMHVKILNAGTDDYFIVTDNPGFTIRLVDIDTQAFQVFNTDYALFQSVFFPLNSKQALLFTDFNMVNAISNYRVLTYDDISSEFVTMLNRASLQHTSGKIFCRDKKYLKLFLDQLPKPNVIQSRK